jgi:hypothetical protein
MKTLSIRQPWAWAILHGKNIENRSWPTNFHGEFLIHASSQFDKEGYIWLCKNSHLLSGNISVPSLHSFLRGHVIGISEILDCFEFSSSPWFFGPFGFLLINSRPIEPFKAKGQLGFFDIPYHR